MSAMLLTLKVLALTGVFSLVSIELGGEFFAAVNTALNLLTVMYVTRTHRDVHQAKPRIEEVAEVAKQLDTRQVGGRRSYDQASECE